VAKLDPEREFTSFWEYETTIGERPTQEEILKSHIKNWKSLNLKQRKIVLGFLNARRSKDAKSSFVKELKILGQKIAF
jgi:large subunit ribosomal protein L47